MIPSFQAFTNVIMSVHFQNCTAENLMKLYGRRLEITGSTNRKRELKQDAQGKMLKLDRSEAQTYLDKILGSKHSQDHKWSGTNNIFIQESSSLNQFKQVEHI